MRKCHHIWLHVFDESDEMKAKKGDQYGTKMRRTHLKSTKRMEQCKNSGNQTVKEAKDAFFYFHSELFLWMQNRRWIKEMAIEGSFNYNAFIKISRYDSP